MFLNILFLNILNSYYRFITLLNLPNGTAIRLRISSKIDIGTSRATIALPALD